MTNKIKSKIATALFFIAATAASSHSNNIQTSTLTVMGFMESKGYNSTNEVIMIDALSSLYGRLEGNLEKKDQHIE